MTLIRGDLINAEIISCMYGLNSRDPIGCYYVSPMSVQTIRNNYLHLEFFIPHNSQKEMDLRAMFNGDASLV
jgi:hypothetical protein